MQLSKQVNSTGQLPATTPNQKAQLLRSQSAPKLKAETPQAYRNTPRNYSAQTKLNSDRTLLAIENMTSQLKHLSPGETHFSSPPSTTNFDRLIPSQNKSPEQTPGNKQAPRMTPGSEKALSRVNQKIKDAQAFDRQTIITDQQKAFDALIQANAAGINTHLTACAAGKAAKPLASTLSKDLHVRFAAVDTSNKENEATQEQPSTPKNRTINGFTLPKITETPEKEKKALRSQSAGSSRGNTSTLRLSTLKGAQEKNKLNEQILVLQAMTTARQIFARPLKDIQTL
ncbi:hypothetical protein HOH87_06960 [bacterium]|nr:hypothetical protein [bacterium]